MHGVRTAVIVTVMSVAVQAQADTVSITPIKDNTILTNGNSNGAGESVFCGKTGDFSVPPGMTLRALLSFDVAGNIPAGSTITNVDLTLTLLQASLFGVDEMHTVHRLLEDWGEGTSAGIGGGGAPPTPGDATWFQRFLNEQCWSTEGGSFEPTASATTIVTTVPGPHTWSSTPELVADVQSMLDQPSFNFGWIIRGNEIDGFSARRFASREWFVQEQLPMLVIEFQPPSCSGDINGDGVVGPPDLALVLGNWGPCPGCPTDLDGDGNVGSPDLAMLLGAWGPCPQPAECFIDADCDDANGCTGLESCVDGVCVPGTGMSCDDADACTEECCHRDQGCLFEPVTCDDASPCTIDSCDPATGCQFTPVDCDDGDLCTVDSCNPFTGACVNTPVECPIGEICVDGVCVPGP